MQATAVSGTQLLIALGIGIFFFFFLIFKTKVHAFLALIIAAATIGVIGGMNTPVVVKSITTGFGNTLGSIGIVIGFGVMMGQILEVGVNRPSRRARRDGALLLQRFLLLGSEPDAGHR